MSLSVSHPLRVLAMALVFTAACGSHEAPITESNTGDEGGACGTLPGARATLQATATREDLAPLGSLLRARLMETGKWRQLARSALVILRENPPFGLSDALDSLRREEGLAGLMPHVRAVLHYFVGSPKLMLAPGEEFARGEHYGPVNVVADTLRVCQPHTTFSVINRVLSVRVPCAECPGGTRLFAAALSQAIADVIADPELGGVLETLEFSDTGMQQTAIGREAFALLLDTVVAGIASPSFTTAYFDTNLRVIINDVLGQRLSVSSQANLNRLLDVLREGLSPSLDLLPPLQETVGCMLRLDPGHEIANMLFDYVRLESLQWRQFAEELPRMFESTSGEALNRYLARVTRQLANDPTLARDVVGSILPLLVDGAERELLTTLDNLQGKGVGSGILEFAAHFLGRCAREPG